MREKLSALYGKDGTKAVLSSLISILIGMAVGSVIIDQIPPVRMATTMSATNNFLLMANLMIASNIFLFFKSCNFSSSHATKLHFFMKNKKIFEIKNLMLLHILVNRLPPVLTVIIVCEYPFFFALAFVL